MVMLRSVLFVTAVLLPILGAAADGDDGSVLIDRDTYRVLKPAFTLTRPDAEWMFIDLDKQQAELAGTMPARQLEDAFRGLAARMHHSATKATISAYVFPHAPGDPVEASALMARAVEQAKARPKAKVREAAPFALRRRVGSWVRYETTPDPPAGEEGPGETWTCVRIDCPVPESGQLVLLFLEVPKDRYKAGRADLSKVIKRFRWE
jgi:hypothetical protein